jgi:hypothetical protein
MTGQEIVALAVWWAFIAMSIFCIYFLSTMFADAATLSMSGSFAGQGIWNATVEADFIAANISSSRLEIIAGGVA